MGDWDDDQSTLHHAAMEVPVEPDAGFLVRVVSGAAAGSIVVDGSAEVLVGQSPVCTLRLADPTVSRRHASFDACGSALRVRDLGSRNGTWVGAVRVVEALVPVGERIRLGAVTLSVEAAPASAKALPTRTAFGSVVGASREIRRLFPLFERLARANIPVLVEGETGTGKEVLARSLHDEGPRKDGPFVVFDCTAVASTLLESELFGHEKGAFTGAQATRRGVFEQAHGGTLLIDELGDLPLDQQAKLLRAIERSEVRRVGGTQWITCDVRIVAATRRDLDALVAEGKFRDDLFHRLAVGRVELPPLRARAGDVPLLVEHFCEKLGVTASTIPRAVLAEWKARPWPGNLRELRNAVAREIALGELADPPPSTREGTAPDEAASEGDFDAILRSLLPYPEARQRVLDAFRKRYIQAMLEAHGGNVQRAAEASGIALRYFQLLKSGRRG